MRLFLKTLLTAIIAIVLSVPAFASETRVVPANRASAIFFYYTANRETCHYGSKPKFSVVHKPEHGTVTAIWQSYKMGKEARNCNGKPMRGMLVIYKPAPGYHGSDRVSFAFNSSDFGAWSLSKSYSVNIEVK